MVCGARGDEPAHVRPLMAPTPTHRATVLMHHANGAGMAVDARRSVIGYFLLHAQKVVYRRLHGPLRSALCVRRRDVLWADIRNGKVAALRMRCELECTDEGAVGVLASFHGGVTV